MYIYVVKIGIIGGGFGLYGYMPAAVQNNYEVVTLEKYRSTIISRPELAGYVSRLQFVLTEEDLQEECEYLVLARDTASQVNLISKFAGSFKHIFLEKPLGRNSKEHLVVLDGLLKAKQSFSVGYLAPFTNWFQLLNSGSSTYAELSWHCKIDNTSWKSNQFLDRGIFTFYGIHMVPIVQHLNLNIAKVHTNLVDSSLEIRFNSDIHKVMIYLVESETPSFSLISNSINESIVLQTPFGDRGSIGLEDPRVPLLRHYLKKNIEETNPYLNLNYELIAIKLLESIELNH
jgi:predicted dehydrogenase